MVAFLIATYMALYQWRLIGSAWDPMFGSQTEKVLDSQVSERMRLWFLIPDAAFGAIAYLGDAIFGLAGSTRRWQYRPWMVIVFGIDVIPAHGLGRRGQRNEQQAEQRQPQGGQALRGPPRTWSCSGSWGHEIGLENGR